MKIHTMPQGSPEWAAIRRGKVTASEIDSLVTPEGKIRTGDGPTAYLYKKICEQRLGFSEDTGGTFAMNHGTILELEAIPWLAFTNDIEVKRVGFMTTDDMRAGASPDGLIGEDGGVEIKCPQPTRALQYLIEGVVPKEYRLQIQMNLWVSGRSWWYFLSYSRQWPALLIRVERDEAIQKQIALAVSLFNERFDAALSKLTSMMPQGQGRA